MMVFMLGLSVPVRAQETTEGAVESSKSVTGDPDPVLKKQEQATIGMLVLVGIGLAGLGLIGLVIIWGHRIRRVSRHIPEEKQRDELFYLKPSKSLPNPETRLPDEDEE